MATGRLPATRIRLYGGLALVSAGMLGIALTGDLRRHLAAYLSLYAVAGLGYLLVWTAVERLGLKLALVVALALRLVLLPAHPSLSDDYYRYLWDGRVQVAGINPYKYAPASPRLNGVAFADRSKINHPSVQTIYPAAAELLFVGVAKAGGGLYAWKVVIGVFDLGVAAAVAALAGKRRRTAAAALYLLCPVVMLETWDSAHLEVVAVFFVVAAAALLARRRPALAGAALGLGAAVKLTPGLLLVPALLGGRASWRRFLPAFALTFCVPYLPYVLSGAVLGSLKDTGARPQGNSLVFALLDTVLPYAVVRVIVVALFLVAASWISLRLRGCELTGEAFAWCATLALLLMPIVHPWYWLTPVALALGAGLVTPVLLGLVGPAADIAWTRWLPQRGWATVITYAPLLALGPELARRRRAGSGAGVRPDRASGNVTADAHDAAGWPLRG
jgi:hypothetical protein